MARLPTVFLPHGGGPWPFVEMGLDRAEVADLTRYLQSVARLTTPKAILSVSAHWEAPVPTVMTAEHPPLYFDYYGFPEASYRLTWPAPGSPAVAQRVRELLTRAGIPSAADASRGFDHGTFVPFKVAWPEAAIPVVQLSLQEGLDPARHLAIGAALAPLRDEGVLIVGSGMTFHNLRAFRDPRSPAIAEAFDAWLRAAATDAPAARRQRLTAWAEAPAARLSHPREEHLIPLMVAAGAAGEDPGRLAWNGTFMSLRLSAYHYGA